MKLEIAPAALAALALMAGTAAAQDTAPPVTLTLSRAVAVAADTAPGVRIAGLRAGEAEERIREARGALLPTLSAAVSEDRRTQNLETFGFALPLPPGESLNPKIGPVDVFDARLRASTALFDPAGVARVRAVRAAAAGTQAEVSTASETSGARAALAYVTAERAAATVSARREDVRLAGELVTLAQAQLDRGVATALDVTRARTQLAAAQGLLSVAQNQLDQAQVNLARAMGIDPRTNFVIADALGPQTAAISVPADEAEAMRAAMANRPELRSAEAQQRAAQLATRAIQAERLPRLDLAADYGITGLNPRDAFPTYNIAVQVSAPLFDGFRREARQQHQALTAREAGVRAADVRQQVEAEVRSALLDVANGQDQQRIAAERLRLANEELSQAQERFANGLATNIEVINAQQNLVRAKDAVIDAQAASAQARVNLARATGTTLNIR
ncbi:TolC family protein [Longimicrobium sp.]|uniref:TolC family protein n=1 Tax=Longimicrobium sp. TaxID=2029185 RepID=UPI002BBD23AA|nr:TolC family protein [Longimicrobium sp.]HSU14246.1 TolC family protein [Longimicrobium sp.]